MDNVEINITESIQDVAINIQETLDSVTIAIDEGSGVAQSYVDAKDQEILSLVPAFPISTFHNDVPYLTSGMIVGLFATVAFSGDYTDLINKPTIPTLTSDLTNNSGFITVVDIPAIPTNTSDLANDSGFITSSSLPTNLSELSNDTGFITLSSIPTTLSSFTNDTNFITSASVPTAVSQLSNDSGFITSADIPTTLSSFSDDVGFALSSSLAAVATTGSYGDLSNTPSNLSDFNDDLGLVLTSIIGQPSGIVPLDAGGKISTSYIPDSVLGQLEYKGTWNATTNSPTLTNPDATAYGHYYVVQTAGIQFSISFSIGDWVINNNGNWEKVDNTDAVTMVQGRTGAVTITKTDLGLENVNNTSDANKPISTATQEELDLKAYTTDLGVAALSNDYNDLDNLPDIPTSLSDFFDYATTIEAEISYYNQNTVSSILTEFPSAETDIQSVIDNYDLSDFNNDVGFITSADVPTALSELSNDTGFITSGDVSAAGISGDYGDLLNLPTNLSDFNNDGVFPDITGATSLVVITQAAYDLLSPPDSNTIYFING